MAKKVATRNACPQNPDREWVPEVTVAPISTLTLDPNNAMSHPERNVATVTTSLHEYGAGRSIVIRNNVVVAGNCTTESAADAGFTEVIKVKPGPHQLVEVDRSDWTDEQAREYALVDNKSASMAEWKTIELIDQIDLMPLETVKSLGWTEEEIQALRFSLSPPTEEETPTKEPLPKEPKVCPNCGHLLST